MSLDNNTVLDITPLSRLTELRQLFLDNNSISNITPLSGLTNLRELHLASNSITDLSPLVANTGLGQGSEVDVKGNPLNAVSINTHIPTLRERGVDVQFDLNTNATVSLSPSSVDSPAVGDQFTLYLRIAGGAKVTGYQASVQFDASALRYVGSADGDYLPAGAFFVPPIVDGDSVTLAGTSLAGESAQNTGTLATITFSVVAVKASFVHLWDVLLTDSIGGSSSPQVQDAVITESPQFPEDVNQDGVVNILRLDTRCLQLWEDWTKRCGCQWGWGCEHRGLVAGRGCVWERGSTRRIQILDRDTMPTRSYKRKRPVVGSSAKTGLNGCN